MVFNPVGGQETRLAGIWLRTIATSADPVPATFGVQNQGRSRRGPKPGQSPGAGRKAEISYGNQIISLPIRISERQKTV